MEKLFTPHLGLMVWTIVTFLLLVVVLSKFGWKPLIQGLEEREDFLRREREGAEAARKAAEELRLSYDKQLNDAQVKVQSLIQGAEKDAQARKEDLLKTARQEADRLTEKTRKELAEEQRRLVAGLRNDVAALAVDAAEKILGKSVDKAVQDKALDSAADDLDKWAKARN